MRISVRYEDGVFKPLEKVEGVPQGKVYRVFSEEELLSLNDNMGWLKAAEPSFPFWDNDDDAIFDSA
jgi:hypothetical protein